MSGPYMFGVKRGALSASEHQRRDNIARKHGVEYVYTDMPDGPRSWFEARNRGAPFDRAVERAVMAEVTP